MTHVLIVEDHEENRNLLKLLLEVNGYRVTAAGDGLEALAAARRDPPDAVVSDALMPKMDGFALCRAWMQDAALKTIPFIFYSATYVRPDDEQFAAALGAVRYLIKPLEAKVFLAELGAVLQQWAGRAAPALAAPLNDLAAHALHESALARKLEDKVVQLETANRKLRESEERFRSLSEMSSDFYWESDAEHRLTQRASAAKKSSAISVFARGAQIGERRWDIPHISPDAAGWAAHRAVLDAHLPFREFVLSRLGTDGTERFISISGDPVFGATGAFTGYRGVGTDITARKRTEKALREGELRYRELFEANPQPAWVYDLETLKFLAVNDAAVAHYGYSRDEFEAMSILDIRPPEDVPRILQRLALVREDDVRDAGLWRHRKKDGTLIDVEVTAHTLDFGGRRAQIVLVIDVTARLHAERELRQSEERYRALTELSSDWYWEQDENLRFTRMSRPNVGQNEIEADTFLGKTRREAPGIVWDEPQLAALEAIGKARQPFRDFEIGRIYRGGPKRYVQMSGEPIFDASGRFSGYRGIGKDVTERRQREVDLLRFRLAIDATADAIYLVDRVSMRFLYVNDAACARLGWTRDEIFALGPEGVLSIPRAELERIYDSTIAGGVATEPIEVFRQRADGKQTWGELQRRAQRSGESWSIVTVVHDITERKRTEAALQAAEEQFRGLVEQSIAGIFIIQDDKFTYVNPRFAEIFGYASAEEMTGRSSLALVAEKDRDAVLAMRHRVEEEGRSLSYTFTAACKDGAEIEVGVHSTRATHHGRPAVIGMAQDISEKKRAEQQIERYVAQLETAFMSTVNVATTLGEMRDPYTAGHQRRVAEIAVAIGAELGFDAHRREGLRVAGYLHDIGKITIPAEILSKPGKLNALEYTLIQGHAQSSYDVLQGVEFPWPVAETARQHHERVDGSGYPQGLKGEEILLEARIMGVADVIEAMSSHRPYRPGLGIANALAEIEGGRGSAYDAGVVDACLRLFRDKGYTIPD